MVIATMLNKHIKKAEAASLKNIRGGGISFESDPERIVLADLRAARDEQVLALAHVQNMVDEHRDALDSPYAPYQNLAEGDALIAALDWRRCRRH